MSARFTLEQISKMSPAIQAQVMADQERVAASHEKKEALIKAVLVDPTRTIFPSPTPTDKTPTMPSKPAKNRIRQNSGGLNKTEQAFHDWLLIAYPGQKVMSQMLTLRLANGCRYTPDEIIYDPATLRTFAYEIKGPHAWDDSIVKLKVAASLFYWITFYLVTRKKGEWQIQEVLP